MRIRKECVDSIIERSERDPLDLLHIITSFTPEPRKEGASYKTACPLCGAEHSLIITPGKKIFKCFNCNDLSGKKPIDYLMKGQRKSYPEALEWLASYYGVVVEYDEPARYSGEKCNSSKKGTFCKRMLEGSGLTEKDVIATVNDINDSHSKFKQATFTPGAIDNKG